MDPFTGGLAATRSTAYRSELTQGGSAYSTQPAATVRSNKILPSKQYLAFKDIKVDAAKNKIKQLNEEIKVSNVSGEERQKLTTARIGLERRRRKDAVRGVQLGFFAGGRSRRREQQANQL